MKPKQLLADATLDTSALRERLAENEEIRHQAGSYRRSERRYPDSAYQLIEESRVENPCTGRLTKEHATHL